MKQKLLQLNKVKMKSEILRNLSQFLLLKYEHIKFSYNSYRDIAFMLMVAKKTILSPKLLRFIFWGSECRNKSVHLVDVEILH